VVNRTARVKYSRYFSSVSVHGSGDLYVPPCCLLTLFRVTETDDDSETVTDRDGLEHGEVMLNKATRRRSRAEIGTRHTHAVTDYCSDSNGRRTLAADNINELGTALPRRLLNDASCYCLPTGSVALLVARPVTRQDLANCAFTLTGEVTSHDDVNHSKVKRAIW